MANIPFLDLKKINALYKKELIKACEKVIDSGWYIRGPYVEQFEHEFSKFCGTDFCIGVANGLDALTLVLKSWIQLGKLQVGDEVIVPANTYIATILAILNANLKPVFLEPSPSTFNIEADQISKKINKKTRVVLVVHLYGRIANMLKIRELCDNNSLLLLEDCAQSHGASIDQKIAGAWGDAGAFSFYPGKNLGALGDAGAITTSDPELAKHVKALANYGSEQKYVNSFQGVNSRLDEIQASMLSVKLKYLNSEINRRRQIARSYAEGISNKSIENPVTVNFFDRSLNEHVFHLYVVKTPHRQKLESHLSSLGISTLIHYPIAPHEQKALDKWQHLNLPITKKLHQEVLSLPISPTLSSCEVNTVIEACNSFRH